jgi:hypothetical protein
MVYEDHACMPVTSRVATRFFLHRCLVGPMEIHVGPLRQQNFENSLVGQVTVKKTSLLLVILVRFQVFHSKDFD